MGQKNGRARIWAKTGTRPCLPADQRYTNAYLLGAICPMGAKGAALMLPFANTRAMQIHLDEIGCNVAALAHGVVLMDRAGWHSTDKLKVPKNLTIILLPSRSPELNPVENIWLEAVFVFGLGLIEEVEGGVLDDGEVLRSEAASQPREIVVEDHVEDPVEPVLDAPVGAPGTGEQHGVGGQRRDIEMLGGLALAVALDLALDQGDGLQAGPGMALLEPVDIVGCPVAADFQAAMVTIDGLMEAGLAVGEARGPLFGEEELEIWTCIEKVESTN